MGRIVTIREGGKTHHRGRAKATTAAGSRVDRRHQIGAVDWVKSGKWVNVSSSNVQALMYDYPNKTLYVQFHGGNPGGPLSTYSYAGVSPERAKTLYNAPSVGKGVWKLRRAGFEGVKV